MNPKQVNVPSRLDETMQCKAVTVLLVSAILLIVSMLTLGYAQTFSVWGIQVGVHPFSDLRVILCSFESSQMGYDPLISNPADHPGGALNYPRIWIAVSSLLGSTRLEFCGTVLAAMFFCAVAMLVPYRPSVLSYGVFFASVFSPAVLLGVERGNSDLLILVLVVIAATLSTCRPLWIQLCAFLILLFSVMLKIFPFFAAGILIRNTLRRGVLLIIAFAICCLCYAVFTWHDLLLIRKATPRGVNLSYGRDVVWMAFLTSKPNLSLGLQLASQLWCSAVFLVAALMIVWPRVSVTLQPYSGGDSFCLNCFRCSSYIYIGTFLLGNNYDYRLMFLLLAIPQLSVWLDSSCASLRRLSLVLIGCALLCQWEMVLFKLIEMLSLGGSLFTLVFVICEFASWIVFTGMVFLLAGVHFVGLDQQSRPLVAAVL